VPASEIVYRLVDQTRTFPGMRPCSRCHEMIETATFYCLVRQDGRRHGPVCRPCVYKIAANRRMVVREEATRLVLLPATPSQPEL